MTENQRNPGPHPLPVFLAAVTRACGSDRTRLAQVLAGLRRYQQAERPVPQAIRPLVAERRGVGLRAYGGSGPLLVMVPSLINPASVLDLAPGNSLLEALAAAGVRPLLVDWGTIPADSLSALVTEHLIPLLDDLGEPVALAGYCLGGTLALAAAQLRSEQVSRLALIATPWHFTAWPDGDRHGLADWWAGTRALATGLGAVPMDLLQPAFWALDEAGLADKFARLAEETDPAAVAAFVRLEDWTNSGTALPLPVATELFETLFTANATGLGRWSVAGTAIAPATLPMPVLDLVSSRDRLVPAEATISAAATTTPATCHRHEVAAGHVGMIVGRGAPENTWRLLADWLGR